MLDEASRRSFTVNLADVEDADVQLGLHIMAQAHRQYAERVEQGHRPRRVLVSTRYRTAVHRSMLKVQNSDREPFWIRMAGNYRLQVVFSPDLPDVYVPIELEDKSEK